MGNESSQLERPGDMPNRRRLAVGPAISPLSSDIEDITETGKVFGPEISPLPSDDEINEPIATSPPVSSKPPSKKKKKKHRKSLESVASIDAVPTGAAVPSGSKGILVPEDPKKTKKLLRKKQLDQEEDAGGAGSMQSELQGANIDDTPQSSKRKSKKKSKKYVANEDDGHEQDDVVGKIGNDNPLVTSSQMGSAPLQASEIPPTPMLGKKKRTRGKKRGDDNPDAQQPLFPPVVGNSLPSAQPPAINNILKYEPGLGDDTDEAAIIPMTQPSTGLIDISQIKTEPAEDDLDNDPTFQFAGISVNASFADAVGDPTNDAIYDDNLASSLGWLHKREEDDLDGTPITDTRTDEERAQDMALPDLHPSQIKSEPESHTNSDSDSESPSMARLGRLERSRSRSASRTSTSRSGLSRLADQDLGLSTRSAPRPLFKGNNHSSLVNKTPATGPSSTGSNLSIPARLESEAGSHSRHSSESEPGRSSSDEVRLENDVMDIDGDVSVTDRQADDPIDTQENASALSKHAKKLKKAQKLEGDNEMSDRNIHLMANWIANAKKSSRDAQVELSNNNGLPDDNLVLPNHQLLDEEIEPVESTYQPEKSGNRRVDGTPVSKVQKSGPLAATEATIPEPDDVQNTNSSSRPQSSAKKRRLPKSSWVETEGADEAQHVSPANAAAVDMREVRDESVQPGESASQPKPKGKKKRKLQAKNSVSLTQIEGGDVTEGESRLSTFSQKSKCKDMMRGGSNEPEEGEMVVDREPTPALPAPPARKPKKKRRSANNASDDEMESLLAAGPSKARKRASKLGLGDIEDVRAAKRKRLSKNKGEFATGPWTNEELSSLGRVVSEFRDENNMTQYELNSMIHERPEKANSLHQNFWNKADATISQRTRKQVVERTRRLYNNFTARGTWTEEQKEELHELLEKHGNKFSEIAGMLNRDQKDIRDYWRNQYLVHETQIKSRWSKEEEQHLQQVVEEALGKIQIMRENNDQFRPRPRATGLDDESLLDWQQISAAMGLTRSRQQCKWKWSDLREKGVVGDGSIVLPRQTRSDAAGSGKLVNGISEDLANARDDFRVMGDDEKLRLVESIHDSGVHNDGAIRWSRLVDEHFRLKWRRPTLKLAWYRLRQTVPDYEDNDVEANARYLINYFNGNQTFPHAKVSHVDEHEERLIHRVPGSRLWKRPSEGPRAIKERQRRSSSVSSRASNRLSHKVSSEILRIGGSSDDDDDANRSRAESVNLGDQESEERPRGRGPRHDGEDVLIRIPKHLKGEAAKRALAEARAKADAKGKGKDLARGTRSASVAIDSDSE